MGEKITIRDVAKHAGVSAASVSYVLNGINKVSDETKERTPFDKSGTLAFFWRDFLSVDLPTTDSKNSLLPESAAVSTFA